MSGHVGRVEFIAPLGFSVRSHDPGDLIDRPAFVCDTNIPTEKGHGIEVPVEHLTSFELGDRQVARPDGPRAPKWALEERIRRAGWMN